jgi:hypothetical protein
VLAIVGGAAALLAVGDSSRVDSIQRWKLSKSCLDFYKNRGEKFRAFQNDKK